jgi:hypothetical protein
LREVSVGTYTENMGNSGTGTTHTQRH